MLCTLSLFVMNCISYIPYGYMYVKRPSFSEIYNNIMIVNKFVCLLGVFYSRELTLIY